MGANSSLQINIELNWRKARCAGISYPTHRPELNEVLECGGGHKQAIYQRVGQEQDEVLVVCERHTVVHPGAVMVHLQYAPTSEGTSTEQKRRVESPKVNG